LFQGLRVKKGSVELECPDLYAAGFWLILDCMKGSELERKVRKGCHQLQPSPLLVQPLKFYSKLD